MDNTWFLFVGENGINAIFDEELNKHKKHQRDDALVPFKTKNDKNRYESFSGVIGSFNRLLSDTEIKKNTFDKDYIHKALRDKFENCSDEEFDLLISIIEDLYFDNGSLLPVNAKALNYIQSNITQEQVAEFLYSIFIEGTDLKDAFLSMSNSEDTNVLEELVFNSFVNPDKKPGASIQRADCFLPYVKEVFVKDFNSLIKNTDYYKENIERFLAYYYMFYINQLAVKLMRFEDADRNEIEQIYLTLNWEVISKVRYGYEYGWKKVQSKLSHMFTHSVLIEMLSRNIAGEHFDYIGFYNEFMNSDLDSSVSDEIDSIRSMYESWIPMDYSSVKIFDKENFECKVSASIRNLFETIDYQFINGGRVSHYNAYNKKYISFVQENFAKRRGTLGYTIGLNESDVIMFTQIILSQNDGMLRLSKLFDEFEKRGMLFDKESKKHITDLFEKMNYLEKRSDSGDAQYVKSIL